MRLFDMDYISIIVSADITLNIAIFAYVFKLNTYIQEIRGFLKAKFNYF